MRVSLFLKISLAKDGPMGSGKAEPRPAADKNRKRYLRSLGLSSVVRVRQVHGTKVQRIDQQPKTVLTADGLITGKQNIFLSIFTADCFPLFFYDRKLRAVGICHAGWKGTMKGIVPAMLRRLKKEYGVKPQDLRVTIGPGIQKCHFEVWPETRHREMRAYLSKFRRFIMQRGKRTFVDLEGILYAQLIAGGISKSAIDRSPGCTYHNAKYLSYRRDKNRGETPAGNMVSIIGLKKV